MQLLLTQSSATSIGAYDVNEICGSLFVDPVGFVSPIFWPKTNLPPVFPVWSSCSQMTPDLYALTPSCQLNRTPKSQVVWALGALPLTTPSSIVLSSTLRVTVSTDVVLPWIVKSPVTIKLSLTVVVPVLESNVSPPVDVVTVFPSRLKLSTTADPVIDNWSVVKWK